MYEEWSGINGRAKTLALSAAWNMQYSDLVYSLGTVYQPAFALNHGIFSVCHRRPCNHLYYAVCSDTFRRERIKRPVCKDSLWTITWVPVRKRDRDGERAMTHWHYRRWQSGRFHSHACVYVGRWLTDAEYLHCVAVQLSLVSGIKRRKFRAD